MKDINYLRDTVENEGLGYAVLHYLGPISESKFDVDYSVIDAWNRAEQALRELDELLGLNWV